MVNTLMMQKIKKHFCRYISKCLCAVIDMTAGMYPITVGVSGWTGYYIYNNK